MSAHPDWDTLPDSYFELDCDGSLCDWHPRTPPGRHIHPSDGQPVARIIVWKGARLLYTTPKVCYTTVRLPC